MYDYHIEYKKGSKLGNADALSRLPLTIENDIEMQNVHVFAETTSVNIVQVAVHTFIHILSFIKMNFERNRKRLERSG